jgi:hypothetical protein
MASREREINGVAGSDLITRYDWILTGKDHSDIVRCITRPYVLPVIFVPGIMGSNLRSKSTGESVWSLNTRFGQPFGILGKMMLKGPGDRQRSLNPDTVEVDPDGDVPSVPSIGDEDAVRARGWGGVSESSYKKFLVWLEQHLNQIPMNPARWSDFYQSEASIGPPSSGNEELKLSPGIEMGVSQQDVFKAKAEASFESLKTDDLLARARFRMPVYACGYNWLGSCSDAAEALEKRIDDVIAEHDKDPTWCKQVVLVTHSMGGLVARSCVARPGVADKVAGVVHGVMPATGAAVAYRRCKVGMADEDYVASLVIGSTGQEVTAVFAQAPGALQLLPNKQYGIPWLRLAHGTHEKAFPTADPYTTVYLERDKWWGLLVEPWLSPSNGAPIDWTMYKTNIKTANAFHDSIGDKYHAKTYVFYGNNPKSSFRRITWTMREGLSPDGKPRPSLDEVAEMTHSQVRENGSATAYVGGGIEVMPSISPMAGPTVYESSYWELHCDSCDGSGDGTVPDISGQSPKLRGGGNIQQQFGLTGFEHEPAYKKSDVARFATLYSLMRIAGIAKQP